MSITYKVYWNSGNGEPIDYANPLANLSTPSFETGTLVAPGDYLFGVRTFDSDTNLEESNTNIRVRLILNALGRDVTGRPSPPFALNCRLTNSGAQISWCHRTTWSCLPPTGFRVYLGTSAGVDYSTPVNLVNYSDSIFHYTADLINLVSGLNYSVCVRAFNAIDEESNIILSSFAFRQTLFSQVGNLTISR